MSCARFLALVASVVVVAGCDPSGSMPPAAAQNSGFIQYVSGEPVQRGKPLQFPADHGMHPQQSIEWWYLTGNLRADTGERFGVQWTLFRARLPQTSQAESALDNPWWQGQLYFAHFALQSHSEHHAFERFARAGQVQIQASPFLARIDDWRLASVHRKKSGAPAFLPLRLQAHNRSENAAFATDLILDDSPLVVQGEAGYSEKTPQGDASYYYSLPFLSAAGSLRFKGKTYRVSGSAWLDREWSGGLLSKDYAGWDWFSLQSDTGQTAIMAFCVRGLAQRYQYCDATRISRHSNQSTAARIRHSEIRLAVLNTVQLGGKTYPIQWQLSLGADTFTIEASNPDSRNQLSFPYWEGRVQFMQSGAEKAGLQGYGYVELTGY